jgi:hypothetical protein
MAVVGALVLAYVQPCVAMAVLAGMILASV